MITVEIIFRSISTKLMNFKKLKEHFRVILAIFCHFFVKSKKCTSASFHFNPKKIARWHPMQKSYSRFQRYHAIYVTFIQYFKMNFQSLGTVVSWCF